MNAITIIQPWATMIDEEMKTIETRTHDRFKILVGQRIAIHAGKKFDENAVHSKYFKDYKNNTPPWWLYDKERHLLDCVLCTAFVKEHRWLTSKDNLKARCECEGLFGLVLEDIKQLQKPIYIKGKQGIWNLPDDLI